MHPEDLFLHFFPKKRMLTDLLLGLLEYYKGVSVSAASLKNFSNKLVKFKNISWICQQWKYIFKFDIYINPNVHFVKVEVGGE